MRECACPVPEPTTDLNGSPKCTRCGFALSTEWVSSDDKLDEFFEQLALWADNPSLEQFRALCFAREKSGRHTFKLRYLGRDNVAEAMEEAADGAMYPYLETLKNRRAGLPEMDDVDLYHAAHSFALAYLHLARYRQRQLGH